MSDRGFVEIVPSVQTSEIWASGSNTAPTKENEMAAIEKIKDDFQIKIFRHKKKWYWDVYSDQAQMGIFGPDTAFDNVDDVMKDIAKAIKKRDLDEQNMLFLGL